MITVATSGWALPAAVRAQFPDAPSLLARYAAVFRGVEITSSFYRPHRPATYARWAATTPPAFRFSVKAPREITHVRKLHDVDEPLQRFLDESAALGEKRAVILVQLAPKHACDTAVAAAFF